jgi:hypothetical protein
MVSASRTLFYMFSYSTDTCTKLGKVQCSVIFRHHIMDWLKLAKQSIFGLELRHIQK